MSALLEAARLHQPLPPTPRHHGWGPTDAELAVYRKAGRICQLDVPKLGASFMVCWDEDLADYETPHKCWCEAIQCGTPAAPLWLWTVECHSQIWRDLLDDALQAMHDNREQA